MTIVSPVPLPAVHPFRGTDVSKALAERAERFASKTFLIWEPGGPEPSSWTYATFARDVDAITAGLVARGVGAGDPVMLLLENCPAFLLCWFACARIGAVAVDVNTRYAHDELRHAIGLTGPAGIITHDHLIDRLADLGQGRWVVTIDAATGTCPALQTAPGLLPARVPDPGAALCVQFTSGTTARPKAVLFTHANALWGARIGASHARFKADDVTLVHAPLFHTAALSWQTLSTFWVGGTVVLQPKFSASRFWDVSLRHGCTQTNLLGLMMTVLAQQEVPSHSYRAWQFGLEVPSVAERYGVRLFNAWGMTEIVTQGIINDPDWPSEPLAIGRPAPEYEMRCARGDGTDTDPDEVGDLLVRGVRGLSIFAGYHGDPEATAVAFDSRGFFRTGDRVAVLASGAIRFDGRAKDMLKISGENVAAVEIERVLLGVAGVTEAAVVGVPDSVRDEIAVAFVVLGDHRDHGAVAAEAIARCTSLLADFKVPRRVHVVDELPRVTMGKVSKVPLRALALDLA